MAARSRRKTNANRGPDGLEGRARVVIEGVEPEVDCGRFPAKGVVGDPFVVECDAFADGHDAIRVVLLYRTENQRRWREEEMRPVVNDRWRASFVADEPGRCVYTIEAWVDPWTTWRRDLDKRLGAGQDVATDLEIGAAMIAERAAEAPGRDGDRLRATAEDVRAAAAGEMELDDVLAELDGDAGALMRQHDPRRFATRHPRELDVVVDRERAAFSAWYELFPRSTGPDGEHGTFETARSMLPYVAEMGFDVVYLPPIHPIGVTKRKGRNNAVEAEPGDVGSPWAIGGEAGGHTAIEPALGTLDDFRRFREDAEERGIEIALDVAFQCSPDHPWVEEHPEWFRHRPDGSIQYAENPPKKYEDIYPINFESEDWWGLWQALRDVFLYWVDQGVTIFRVDNPHTKALPFWAWCIPEVKKKAPGAIFLSEAFTRPKVMYHLAKLGFTQSYTYFAWRNQRWELAEYVKELTGTEVRHYFRPNFWPNTPDILTEALQTGGRPVFMLRAALAATLTASWGIYGPAFELLAHRPRNPGSEEYLDSEKYELVDWDLERPDSLRPYLTRLNRIRARNRALQRNENVVFHATDNEQLLCFSKRSRDGDNTVLVVANLDPHHRQSGWTDLDLEALGVSPGTSFQVHDLLGDARYLWHDRRNYVEIDPHVVPVHVFRVIARARTERDFDYYG